MSRSARVTAAVLVCGVVGLAACTPGSAPPDPPVAPGTPWFEERGAAAGLAFELRSGHDGRYLLPEGVFGGAALFDMDDDGDLDAYLVQGGAVLAGDRQQHGNRLFRNNGNGQFEDVTAGSGADDRRFGIGVTTGDYDDDGRIDLYVTNLGRNTLLHNEGDGRFRDVTDVAGVGDRSFGAGAAFVDHDRDGDLDLFVTNYVNWVPGAEIDCFNPQGGADYCLPTNYNAPAADTLYRNEGDGTFRDVSVEAGLRAAFGNGLGVAAADFTGDGLPDLFVANDSTVNQFWVNQGDGTFRDEAIRRGCALDEHGRAKAGMGVTYADVDDDDDLDLIVVNLREQSDSYFRNDGELFVDRTASVGLATRSRAITRFGVGLVDFDQDGRLDLFMAGGGVQRRAGGSSADPFADPDLLYRGGPGPSFSVGSPRSGLAGDPEATSRAAAFGDVDGDGDVDILVTHREGPPALLINEAPDAGNWLRFKVRERSGRDAIGATVRLTVGDRRLRREVASAWSYCAANDPRPHFGLGAAATATGVTVQWVDGVVERFPDAAANRQLELRRGSGTVDQP